MQGTELVQKKKIDDIMKLAFQIGAVKVFESYSEMDEEIIEIKNYDSYLSYIEDALNKKKNHIAFGLYYKEAEGFWNIQKIDLNPRYCDGKTFRYKIEGWGIIYVQIDFTKENTKCNIVVNSAKRAQTWESTTPALKSPNLWNWKIVESKARKLIRALKK